MESKKREDHFYDNRVDVMWDPKAWMSEDCAEQWFEKFFDNTESLRKEIGKNPSIVMQVDNLATQNVEEIKKMCWVENVFIVNTPPNCTDLVALIDHHVGINLKNDISDMFWKEFEKDEESLKFFSDEITEAHWRVYYTRWAGQAWENLINRDGYIEKMAKHVGYCNCICGCENHLIKLFHGFDYEPPKKEDPKMEPLTKEQIENLMLGQRNLQLERKNDELED